MSGLYWKGWRTPRPRHRGHTPTPPPPPSLTLRETQPQLQSTSARARPPATKVATCTIRDHVHGPCLIRDKTQSSPTPPVKFTRALMHRGTLTIETHPPGIASRQLRAVYRRAIPTSQPGSWVQDFQPTRRSLPVPNSLTLENLRTSLIGLACSSIGNPTRPTHATLLTITNTTLKASASQAADVASSLQALHNNQFSGILLRPRTGSRRPSRAVLPNLLSSHSRLQEWNDL